MIIYKNKPQTIPLKFRDIAGNFVDNPIIEIGDIQISKDGGAFANVASVSADPLPTAIAGTSAVPIALTAEETNADYIVIRALDQSSPIEWTEILITETTDLNYAELRKVKRGSTERDGGDDFQTTLKSQTVQGGTTNTTQSTIVESLN